MALSVANYETMYGVNAEHWVIDIININDKYKFAEINLNGYISEATYSAGNTPIKTVKIKINWEDEYERLFSKRANISTNIYEVAYEYIKRNVKEFKDAVDC